MNLDLTYNPEEDRMKFSLRGNADWLLTRSLLLKFVSAWVQKLEGIELPNVSIPLGPRDLALEHSLSLEFDGPQKSDYKPEHSNHAKLLSEITLTVDSLGTSLCLKGEGLETKLSLTRKESHTLLEMLAQKSHAVGWLDAVQLPPWLGVNR
jgi:hypothetical protein